MVATSRIDMAGGAGAWELLASTLEAKRQAAEAAKEEAGGFPNRVSPSASGPSGGRTGGGMAYGRGGGEDDGRGYDPMRGTPYNGTGVRVTGGSGHFLGIQPKQLSADENLRRQLLLSQVLTDPETKGVIKYNRKTGRTDLDLKGVEALAAEKEHKKEQERANAEALRLGEEKKRDAETEQTREQTKGIIAGVVEAKRKGDLAEQQQKFADGEAEVQRRFQSGQTEAANELAKELAQMRSDDALHENESREKIAGQESDDKRYVATLEYDASRAKIDADTAANDARLNGDSAKADLANSLANIIKAESEETDPKLKAAMQTTVRALQARLDGKAQVGGSRPRTPGIVASDFLERNEAKLQSMKAPELEAGIIEGLTQDGMSPEDAKSAARQFLQKMQEAGSSPSKLLQERKQRRMQEQAQVSPYSPPGGGGQTHASAPGEEPYQNFVEPPADPRQAPYQLERAMGSPAPREPNQFPAAQRPQTQQPQPAARQFAGQPQGHAANMTDPVMWAAQQMKAGVPSMALLHRLRQGGYNEQQAYQVLNDARSIMAQHLGRAAPFQPANPEPTQSMQEMVSTMDPRPRQPTQ